MVSCVFENKSFLSDKTTKVVSEILAAPNLIMNPVNTIELNKICEEIEHLKHIWFPNIDDNKIFIVFRIDNLELIH